MYIFPLDTTDYSEACLRNKIRKRYLSFFYIDKSNVISNVVLEYIAFTFLFIRIQFITLLYFNSIVSINREMRELSYLFLLYLIKIFSVHTFETFLNNALYIYGLFETIKRHILREYEETSSLIEI